MRIAVDVDGVVADLHGEWLRLYNADYNDNVQVSDINTWEMHPHVICGNKIYDYLNLPTLYDGVKPIDGAIDVVRGLRRQGHEVFYATTNVLGMTDQKWRWLVRHGFIDVASNERTLVGMVVLSDKTLVDADVLIDDKMVTIEQWCKKGRVGFLYNQPWNQGPMPGNAFRAGSWQNAL